jgi:glutamate decarboxylase
MVHLARIRNDSEIEKPPVQEPSDLSLDAPGEDEFSTAVYGSRFAAEDLPSHEMPEKEMPKDIAYRMIKDDLSLDGNPMLKYAQSKAYSMTLLTIPHSLASFVTTYMVWRTR